MKDFFVRARMPSIRTLPPGFTERVNVIVSVGGRQEKQSISRSPVLWPFSRRTNPNPFHRGWCSQLSSPVWFCGPAQGTWYLQFLHVLQHSSELPNNKRNLTRCYPAGNIFSPFGGSAVDSPNEKCFVVVLSHGIQ
jgi:hypothetical protein